MTGKPQGLQGKTRSILSGLETLGCSSGEDLESAESTGIGGNGATRPMSMEVTVKTQLKPVQEVWQAFNFWELLEAETNSRSRRDTEEMLTLGLCFVMVYLFFWGFFSFNSRVLNKICLHNRNICLALVFSDRERVCNGIIQKSLLVCYCFVWLLVLFYLTIATYMLLKKNVDCKIIVVHIHNIKLFKNKIE